MPPDASVLLPLKVLPSSVQVGEAVAEPLEVARVGSALARRRPGVLVGGSDESTGLGERAQLTSPIWWAAGQEPSRSIDGVDEVVWRQRLERSAHGQLAAVELVGRQRLGGALAKRLRELGERVIAELPRWTVQLLVPLWRDDVQLHLKLVAAHHHITPFLELALADAEDMGVQDRHALALVAGEGIGMPQPVAFQPRPGAG